MKSCPEQCPLLAECIQIEGEMAQSLKALEVAEDITDARGIDQIGLTSRLEGAQVATRNLLAANRATIEAATNLCEGPKRVIGRLMCSNEVFSATERFVTGYKRS